MKTINRKKPISRAVLRGERLDEDCKRANTLNSMKQL